MIENSAENITTKTHIKSVNNLKEYSGAYLVSFAVFSERFSFWGLQAIMVLFLMHGFSQSEKNAFTLVGAFGALSYALSLVGGMIADKLLGIWKSCKLGLSLCFLGNIVLFFSYGIVSLNVGLACILVGAGLFSPSSNTVIRMLYEKKPDLKESSFLMICVAGNISGALAPFIYGIFGAKEHMADAFFISALLNFLSLLFFFKYSNNFSRAYDAELHQKNNTFLGQIITFLFVVISLGLLLYKNWLNTILLGAVIPFCYLIIWLYRQLNFFEKQRFIFIFFLTIILLLFYIAVFQIYSSLTIFVDHYVNRNLMGWIIPVPAFASLQCIFFILCAPIVERTLAFFRKKQYSLSLLTKIPLGLVIGTIAFLLFAAGEWAAHQFGSCSSGWMIAGNFFLGLGEVFLYPPILTAIASFSPKRFAGTFMGIFSISLALASYFAGQFAKIINDSVMMNMQQNESFFNLIYAKVAAALVVVAVMSSMIFLCLKKWYHAQEKLISGKTE